MALSRVLGKTLSQAVRRVLGKILSQAVQTQVWAPLTAVFCGHYSHGPYWFKERKSSRQDLEDAFCPLW